MVGAEAANSERRKMEPVKTMTLRQVQMWADGWLRKNRPVEIRPFWLTSLMSDFQTELTGQGGDHANEEGQQQKDDQHEHQGVPRREDI